MLNKQIQIAAAQLALLLTACSTAAPLPQPTATLPATVSVPTAAATIGEALATTHATPDRIVAPTNTPVPLSTMTVPSPTDTSIPAAPTPTATPSMTITVTLQDYRFDPPSLRVPAGETIRLELRNPDHLLHILAIPDASFAEPVFPGTTKVVDFVVDLPPGEYYLYCPVQDEGIHEDLGMFGTLVVESAP